MLKKIDSVIAHVIVLLGVVYADILSVQNLVGLLRGEHTFLSALSLLCCICSVGILTTVAGIIMFRSKDE